MTSIGQVQLHAASPRLEKECQVNPLVTLVGVNVYTMWTRGERYVRTRAHEHAVRRWWMEDRQGHTVLTATTSADTPGVDAGR